MSRILVEISTTGDRLSLHTTYEDFRSFSFTFSRKRLKEILRKRHMIIYNKNSDSFVYIELMKDQDGQNILLMKFLWSYADGEHLKEYSDSLQLPYSLFSHPMNGEQRISIVSSKEGGKIRFHHMKNLRDVARNPIYCRRFEEFLSTHFNRKEIQYIVLDDANEAFGFFFTEYPSQGYSDAGAILLCGQGSMAQYCINT